MLDSLIIKTLSDSILIKSNMQLSEVHLDSIKILFNEKAGLINAVYTLEWWGMALMAILILYTVFIK